VYPIGQTTQLKLEVKAEIQAKCWEESANPYSHEFDTGIPDTIAISSYSRYRAIVCLWLILLMTSATFGYGQQIKSAQQRGLDALETSRNTSTTAKK
jgi:hypothetical protein